VLSYLLRRLAIVVPVLVLVSVISYSLIEFIPGDPAQTVLGDGATPQAIASTRAQLGLNEPFVVRYWHWASNGLHGDLGRSLLTGQPVQAAIGQRVEVTIMLTLCAGIVAATLGGLLGLLSALWPHTLIDRVVGLFVSCMIAAPPFWVGLLLVVPLAVKHPWFAATGYVSPGVSVHGFLRSITLPAVTLGLPGAAIVSRQLRGELTRVLRTPYIEAGRAKGLTQRSLIGKHGLKNATPPVLTVFGVQIAAMLGGAVIVEQVFALPGIGSLAINAISQHDVPVIQGLVLMSAVVVTAVNLLVDLSYSYFSPKVRLA
jgi:peptide/nickel transport system permease protein